MRVLALNETKHNLSVLVAAKPCRIRDSLHLLLKAISGIEIIGHADDSASAMSLVSEHRPALAILDTNLPGEGFAAVLQQIQAKGLQSRCLVLADDARQQREAKDAGADVALLKGFSAGELYEATEQLLTKQKETAS